MPNQKHKQFGQPVHRIDEDDYDDNYSEVDEDSDMQKAKQDLARMK